MAPPNVAALAGPRSRRQSAPLIGNRAASNHHGYRVQLVYSGWTPLRGARPLRPRHRRMTRFGEVLLRRAGRNRRRDDARPQHMAVAVRAPDGAHRRARGAAAAQPEPLGRLAAGARRGRCSGRAWPWACAACASRPPWPRTSSRGAGRRARRPRQPASYMARGRRSGVKAAMAMSLLFAVGRVLPAAAAARRLGRPVHHASAWASNLLEGAIRLGLLLGYLGAHWPRARDPARLWLPRRRAQDDQRLRGGPAAHAARRAALHADQPPLRHHLPADRGRALNPLSSCLLGRPPMVAPVAHRAGARGRRHRLRAHPLGRRALRQPRGARRPGARPRPAAPDHPPARRHHDRSRHRGPTARARRRRRPGRRRRPWPGRPPAPGGSPP